MIEYVVSLVNKHRKSGVLVDTNLLLLYFVGSFNQEEIPKFKRTKQFAIEDYATLHDFLALFKTIVTTPNILTEVNSFSNQLAEHLKPGYFEVFAEGITLLDERYTPSSDISTMSEFHRFGLTDAGILHIARNEYLVLTDDFRLSQYLQTKQVSVLNFNYIRPYNWSYEPE